MSPRAILTGASSGIGRAFAPKLAARGYELILVARRADRLESLKSELEAADAPPVTVVAADLLDPEVPARLIADAGNTLELVVNNAGFGLAGEFHALELERQLDIIGLNIRALTELTRRALPGMIARGRGQVLNIGSVVGHVPVPRLAVYAASKAYVQSFSEAVDAEVRRRGVRVKVLCPGSTRSEFYDVAESGAGEVQRPEAIVMSAEEVADEGLRLLDSSSTSRVAGWLNSAITLGPRLLPRRLLTTISGRFTPARDGA